MMRVWKAFRLDKEGRLRFLFHTHDGSSLVPTNKWIETKRRWVGDSRQRKYRSGFHFFCEEKDIERFNKLTKNKYTILQVFVEETEPKPRSSVKSWLAKRLYVPF